MKQADSTYPSPGPLCVKQDGAIALLTLDNAAKRNVLSRELLERLSNALELIARDASCKVVILRAAGPVFSSGHDLREVAEGAQQERSELFALCSRVMEQIRLLPQPVIAQVEGLATAAGCQLVATCDLVVAAEGASFATPGVKIGLFCTTPGVAVGRALPTKRAMELLLTGSPISATEAMEWGLVNRVVPAERVDEETLALARQIASVSGETLRLGKRAFYEQMEMERPAAYDYASRVMVENAAMNDAQVGMRAFLEKRGPKWGS
jgi:enoyl-CoA hydratase/carnithine racemase